MDIFLYATYIEVADPQLGDNFPPEYEPQRSVTVFDQKGRNPSNRVHPSKGQTNKSKNQSRGYNLFHLEIGMR